MTPQYRLSTGAALGLVAAAALGFGAARLTRPNASPAPTTQAAVEKGPRETLAISPQAIAASQIAVAPADTGGLGRAVIAAATVQATPDADAVLTARAPGTITRILVRMGDAVRAGQTVALIESRDASQITADRAAAAARVGLARRQLERERGLLAQGVSPRADYDSAQANLAVAQADALRASAAAGAARVTGDGRSVAVISPIAGRVTMAAARLGQYVTAEADLFHVADPRRLEVAAAVPPAEAARIRVGDRVELLTRDGQGVAGRVRAATGVVDPQSRTATIIVTPQASADTLSPGQLVQARIFASGGVAHDGITIPQDAVQTLGGRDMVFVRTAQGFRARPVTIAGRSNGMVAIAGGIAAGTRIATTNAFLIKAELEKDMGGEE
ncbi:efflux transporter periplasmic adaptor subunit [Sphingomonas sp. Sph1(2015)]|jgi:cobalt-zinc-cadmium efflux system membrane fusion protein|uniref:efflux RND transporter periplasmic adaptor subunit n=1 Tax=Sphingomonas sp. Sph1(2015) TaxID=1628084 RepID=UPI000977BE61|nr:efflux RND transporter periplasmic adaptor subunit [Sphingomonas sp. Sph1(2015)]OMJ31552.1 efflux transporter periplasmic adaptor subunit [Sphingomonas sp. Sph1(2015)]